MAAKALVLGGKCGCPSVLCKGEVSQSAPSRGWWKSRTNKLRHPYGRGRRTGH